MILSLVCFCLFLFRFVLLFYLNVQKHNLVRIACAKYLNYGSFVVTLYIIRCYCSYESFLTDLKASRKLKNFKIVKNYLAKWSLSKFLHSSIVFPWDVLLIFWLHWHNSNPTSLHFLFHPPIVWELFRWKPHTVFNSPRTKLKLNWS